MMRREAATHTRAEHGGRHGVRGGDAEGVIDYSSSVGPLGPPDSILVALRHGVETALEYPDPEYAALREEVARVREVEAGQVVIGCGATELIYDWCRAFVKPGTGVMVQAPTFAEYASAACLCGGRVEEFASMDVSWDIGGFVSAIPRDGCVFLCNPNNPTGRLLRRKDILEIADAAAKRGSQVLIDESFIEFAPRNSSVIGDVGGRANMYVVHSLTKTFGIPGVRVGYGIGEAGTAAALRATKMPWSVSGIAQEVAMAALHKLGEASEASHIKRLRAACKREVLFLQKAIDSISGFSCVGQSAANFVLVRVKGRTSQDVRDSLLKCGALVRDCKSFGGLEGEHIRVSVRTRTENKMLIRALESI